MLRYLAVSLLILLSTATFAADKSHPRSVDPELQIQLFAEHPTIVTPTGIDVDHKGRVFAVESNTHFPPKGYKGHPTDRILVLEDTNGDGKADKTTVFTDGLKFTMSVKVKPLWLQSRESRVQSREPEKRGAKRPLTTHHSPLTLYVATRSAIYLYHDTNNDLKADKRERIVHLETKGNYPHNGLAGIAFDAMGWMYFGFGENLGAKYTLIGSDGTKLSGGGEGGNVYRCRPDGSQLSRWATGFWNPHASCVDAFGRLFTVDNDPDSRPPCRLLHVIEGGDYGFRFRNGRAGLHPFTAWNGEIPGTLPMVSGTGEAPSGIVAYESDGLPRKYIGNLLVGSWGDHRIDRFVLQPKGASFVSRPEPLIQGGEDFRPVGLAVAPDGSVFCTDWVKRDYKLHGHGRVWRISRKVEPKRKVIDLSTITAKKRKADELGALLSHARLDVRRTAARTIVKAGGEPLVGLTYVVGSKSSSSRLKAECIWAATIFGADSHFTDPDVVGKLSAQDRDMFGVLMGVFIELTRNERGDPGKGASPYLKYLIGSNKSKDAERFRHRLTTTTSWIRVHHHMDWDACVGERGNVTQRAIFALSTNGDPFHFSVLLTVLREAKSERFLDAILNSKEPPLPAYVLALLAKRAKKPKDNKHLRAALKSDSPDVRRVAVQWVAEENLKELKPQVQAVLDGKVMNADLFLATLAALEMLDGKRPQDFDKTPAGRYVLPLVKDPNRPAAVRAVALRLVDANEPSLNEKLFRDLLKSKDNALRLETIRTLQTCRRRFAAKILADVATDRFPWKDNLKTVEEFKKQEKASDSHKKLVLEAVLGLGHALESDPKDQVALNALTKLLNSSLEIRIEVFRSLRSVAGTNRAISKAIYESVMRQTGNPYIWESADQHLYLTLQPVLSEEDRYRKNWKKARPRSNPEWRKFALIKETKYDEFMKRMRMDSAEAGRRVFFHPQGAACYKCHTVNGRGGHIGPDLTTIARTADRRKLAESILEPSKEIAPQFTLWSFVMDDGKVHHGVILGDTRDGKRQRIGTPEGRLVDLPLSRIELRTPQSKSAMPDKLIDRLTASEFRDLLAFLETLK